MHPFVDRCERNTSTFLITADQETRAETLIRSARAVAMDGIFTDMDGRNIISTVGAEAEIDIRETGTGRIVGQAETMDSEEVLGVVP